MFFRLSNISFCSPFRIVLLILFLSCAVQAQENLIWTSQSRNSSESMPCGGGDIGLNVWVENGEIFAYIAKSGTFDENNSLLKLGRVRIKLSPNPFEGKTFKQELQLKTGSIEINGSTEKVAAQVRIWVDVFNPVIHFEINSKTPIITEAKYENWRFEDRSLKGKENNQNSYKWAPQGEVKTKKDQVSFVDNSIAFFHKNESYTVFDVTLKQQGLERYIDELYNPLKNAIFGGLMWGLGLKPAGSGDGNYLNTKYRFWTLKSIKPLRKNHVKIVLLHQLNSEIDRWKFALSQQKSRFEGNSIKYQQATQQWWADFWDRSYIRINSSDSIVRQVSLNYRLFRYMLACNAKSEWPTKFNGGLFTYDPQLTDSTMQFTPDFRNWGGGTHTAQNQRLVYWPMLKNGDFELMESQFKFYNRLLHTAELRTKNAWGHSGASFTEQLENFGLPNPAEFNWKRPAGYDIGMEYNAWLEYQWDTVLEFCLMMLEVERYQGKQNDEYLPFIHSCLNFFKEHYLYLAKQRGNKSLNGDGKLVFYPGSAAETYKMAYNANSTVSGLRVVLERLIERNPDSVAQLPWRQFLSMLPALNFRTIQGHTVLSPAQSWERVNNVESPQLYPVFPWGIFGLSKPGLDTALNTYRYDPDVIKNRSHIGWKQDQIFAARLGLTEDAASLTLKKMRNSGRRFPAFWGPGFDWTPDHNWGGSGMIGLQEMLMQVYDKKIILFPAWPKNWDVQFKLYAPYQTTVQGELKDGKLVNLIVSPKERETDVKNYLEHKQN